VRQNTLIRAPGPGLWKSRDYIASPLPGLVVSCLRNRWFAPPANFHDASGVLYPMPSPRSGLQNPAHCHRFSLSKTLSAEGAVHRWPGARTCLASPSSDNSPVPRLRDWVSMTRNGKSHQGRQNRVCFVELLSSLTGLEYCCDTIPQSGSRRTGLLSGDTDAKHKLGQRPRVPSIPKSQR
jgi:hypothetical protein